MYMHTFNTYFNQGHIVNIYIKGDMTCGNNFKDTTGLVDTNL